MNYKGFPLILKRALAVFILIPMIGQAQGKCPKADGLSATTTETSAELSWTGGSDVVNYQVDVKHGPGTSAYSYSTTTAELTAKVEGLEPGRAYRFRVKTKCEKGSGGSSQWADFTTAGDPTSEVEEAEDDKDKNNGPCPKATNLAILEIDDTSATLGWLGNEKNVSYLVDVHQKEHTPTYKISETVDTTIIFIEGLIPGGNYKFRVKSKCEKNSGGS
ncbi:MAG: fibronectin type III domain-containing protein, partial [Saprospiraceae bacterium]|nr:fibronectin type III domain-containing protein [Saprospiraceae bacterium]